jgi:hypothetical protein
MIDIILSALASGCTTGLFLLLFTRLGWMPAYVLMVSNKQEFNKATGRDD